MGLKDNENILKLKNDSISDAVLFCKKANLNPHSSGVKDFLDKIFKLILDKNLDKTILLNAFYGLILDDDIKQNFLNQVFINLLINISKYPNQSAQITKILDIARFLKDIDLKIVEKTKNEEQEDKNPRDYNKIFTDIKNNGIKLEFLNLYDGINIKNSAEILKITNSGIVFSVDVVQILAMNEEGSGYILSNDYLTNHLKADIVDFDIQKSTIKLTNFSHIANMNANLRQDQRVHPNKFTNVILKGKNSQIYGNLFDISNGGISILSMQDIGTLKQEEEVSANFEITMPTSNMSFNVCLELKLIAQIEYNGYTRYCLQTNDSDNLELIKSFTNARVEETLKELREQAKFYK